MGHQGLPEFPVRDAIVPSGSAVLVTGGMDKNGDGAELSPRGSDFQSLVNQVVELARYLTGASGSAIAFRGEQGTICSARSGEGAPPLGAPVDITSGISKQCLDSGTPLWCEDVGGDGRVDAKSPTGIRVRAVIVVPIYRGDDIRGILGVFSSVSGIFNELHLKWLQQMANWVGSAETISSKGPTHRSKADVHFGAGPDLAVLIAWEPAYRVFFRNFADLVSLRSAVRVAKPSRQMHGWGDIFVETRVPWKQFIESVFLHVVAVAMLLGLSRIWPPEPLAFPHALREAHVVYYPFSQSYPAYERSRPAAYAGQRHTQVPTPGLARAVSPPPDIGETQFRQHHLPNVSVVAPAPELSGRSGLRTVNAPKAAVVPPSPDIRGLVRDVPLIDRAKVGGGSAGAAEISIVPPAPSLNDRAVLTYRARGVPATGVQVVAAPPSIPTGPGLGARARGISAGDGVSQVVPPAPSLAGAGNSVGGGRSDSLAAVAGGSRVVPPPPSMQDAGNFGGGRGTNSQDHLTSQVIPPAPSVPALAGGNSGNGGRAGSLAGARSEVVLSPASAEGDAKTGAATVAKNISPSVPQASGDRSHMVYQDVQLRVVGLAWAPPNSSYFSNFEVFIAEKWINKEKWQFIKLVYVFLPYQKRLSQYGVEALRIRRLRVTRDSSCDENLMKMMWPEDEKDPTGPRQSGHAVASPSTDGNGVLPCYITTADDYRRAISPRR